MHVALKISDMAWTWMIWGYRYIITHSVSHFKLPKITHACVCSYLSTHALHRVCVTCKEFARYRFFLAYTALQVCSCEDHTDSHSLVATTLSALCPQVDDADAVTTDKQVVDGVVRRRVKVNSRARGRAAASRAEEDLAGSVASMRGGNMDQGRAVGFTLEDREPQMGLVSISTAWQIDFGIGIVHCLRLCWVATLLSLA